MIECKTTGGFFTNSYIISNDNRECVIVDPGLSYGKTAEYIKNNYTVKAILLTHAHLDHIDGVQYFLDCPVYIHTKDKDNLFDTTVTLYYMVDRISPYSEGMLDLRVVKNNDVLNLIGHEFKVLFTPGHTEGSCCYLMDDEVLFSGDTLFNHSCGRTDFPTGSYTDIQKSLKFLVNNLKPETVVYPGHDDITTILSEKNSNPFIER